MNYSNNKQKRSKRLIIFSGMVLISLLILFLSQNGKMDWLNSIIQSSFRPVQSVFDSLFINEDKYDLARLKQENSELRMRLIRLQLLEQDNKALRDQFAISQPKPRKLLPATVISMPSVLSRIDTADQIIIDRGSRDSLKKDDLVLYKDNMIGKVSKVSVNLSVVNLLNNKNSSFTAKTLDSQTEGIVKGTEEQKILFDKVLLSESLETGDTVMISYPETFVVGKIKSINKKASDLFQTAEIEQLVDVKKLTKVFILRNN